MPTSTLIIESDPHRTRAALLENDRPVEVYLERRNSPGIVGNVYKGRVARVVPGIQAAFVDIGLERNAFLYVGDVAENSVDRDSLNVATGSKQSIDQLVSTGEELIVQAIKEPLPGKGARITNQVSLAGRLLVLLPLSNNVGISRRIEDTAERARLEDLFEQMEPLPCGLIVRTAGSGRVRLDFEGDLEALEAQWDEILKRSHSSTAPALLRHEERLAERLIRDVVGGGTEAVWVNAGDTCERVARCLSAWDPELVAKLRIHQEPPGLFERFGIDKEIEAALRRRVWLKSGGYLVIHPTEALVAIDVNSGRYVGDESLEDTMVQINLEAAHEIARQIRLRDLSGIVVVDFIDMEMAENRQAVLSVLERDLARDRAKTQVLGMSEFGLVQITRRRKRLNLERMLTQPCPHCGGRGRVKSASAVCLDLRRDLLGQLGRLAGKPLAVRVHPRIGGALEGEASAVLEELERVLEARILIESDPELEPEGYEFRALDEA